MTQMAPPSCVGLGLGSALDSRLGLESRSVRVKVRGRVRVESVVVLAALVTRPEQALALLESTHAANLGQEINGREAIESHVRDQGVHQQHRMEKDVITRRVEHAVSGTPLPHRLDDQRRQRLILDTGSREAWQLLASQTAFGRQAHGGQVQDDGQGLGKG